MKKNYLLEFMVCSQPKITTVLNRINLAGIAASAMCLASLICPISQTFAGNLYISQFGGGDGSSAGSTLSLGWFNTPDSWGVGPGKISPGDTVHLVGIFTNYLQIMGSGTPGSPVTIQFDSGAKFSSPTWNSVNTTPNGHGTPTVFRGINLHDVIIDGGTDGQIEATDNGMFHSYSNSFNAMSIEGAANVEIRNLTITNLYYRVESTECGGAPQGINLELGDGNTNVFVHNNSFGMLANGIVATYSGFSTNVQIYSNLCNYISWGLFVNAGAGADAWGWKIWANQLNHFEAWNPLNGPCAGSFHSDGIIVNANNGSGTNHAIRVYRNIIGPSVHVASALIYINPADPRQFPDMLIYNNLLAADTNTTQINTFIACGSAGGIVVNNTFAGSGGGQMLGLSTNITVLNNLTHNVGMAYNYYYVNKNLGYAFTNILKISDYNALSGPLLTSDNFSYPWHTFQDWKAFSGFDSHSITNTILLRADFSPTTANALAGTNLTALGITDDFYGNPRPATGKWTIGAFEISSLTPRPPAPMAHTPVPVGGP